LDGFGGVGRDADTLLVHASKMKLTIWIVLFSRLAVPFYGLGWIPACPFTDLVQGPKQHQRARVTLLGQLRRAASCGIQLGYIIERTPQPHLASIPAGF